MKIQNLKNRIFFFSQEIAMTLAKEIYIYKISNNDTFEFCAHINDPGGLSFEDVKSKLNMDLSEPVDSPYWGYQLKICDISYNGIKVCLTFQFGKLVMVIYDTFRPLTEKVMNDSSKVHGNPVEYGHWKTNDVDFLIYEDYYLDEQTYGYKQSYEIPHVE